jgi:para-nitrobenzyl esterase
MADRSRVRRATTLALALLSGSGVAAASAQTVERTIDSGVVEGVAAGPAAVFRAIPYAAPPVGPLRWKPPHATVPWSAPRAADKPGPACPQPVTPGAPNLGGYSGPTDEDCLTLDVTAPASAQPGVTKAPVMVWVYGGGNTSGAVNLPSYDAKNFARDGVIVVAMNYRLGPLGFFAHPALTAEASRDQGLANFGLMDQIAALRWVRRNIAAFGGDPDNVTLFGESAGGLDVLELMAIPTARGLFERAIVESGTGGEPTPGLAHGEAEGAALASRAGLPGAQATAAELRALPVSALLAAAHGAQIVVDGRVVEEPLATAFARGDEARVPLIIGWNSNEASLMRAFGMSPAQWVARTPEGVKAAYGAQAGDPAALARDLFDDEVMGAPARWYAAQQAAHHAPAWLYYFSYVPERQRGERPGTNHASEIPFVFDSIDAIPGRSAIATPSERDETRLAHACWVAFAETGTPDCAGGAWPRYDAAREAVFEFGDPPGVRERFRKAQLDAQEAALRARVAAPDPKP